VISCCYCCFDPSTTTFLTIQKPFSFYREKRASNPSNAGANNNDEEAHWAISREIDATTDIYESEEFTTAVRNFSNNVTRSRSDTEKAIFRLYEMLSLHPNATVRAMADRIVHPLSGRQMFRLEVLVGGLPDFGKKNILNTMLLIFARSLYLKKYDGVDVNASKDTKLKADVSLFYSSHNLIFP
jgi:hypothetical protein